MTQTERVHQYMRDFGSITQLEAMADLGVMRLASRINDMKRQGAVTEGVQEMDSAELIKGLKDAERYIAYVAPSCYASNEALEAIRDAADLIEAQAKRIADLESNLPMVESVLVDKLNLRIAELESETARLKWMTSGKDVPTEAYKHGFFDGEQAVSVDLRSVRKGEQE